MTEEFPLIANTESPPDTITKVQYEQKYWSEYNFPNGLHPWVSTLGAAEEVGELAHHVLKMYQNIRGSNTEHKVAIIDAIGDISIYLIDLCNRLDISFTQSILDTWKEVRKRDWQRYPNNGRTK